MSVDRASVDLGQETTGKWVTQSTSRVWHESPPCGKSDCSRAGLAADARPDAGWCPVRPEQAVTLILPMGIPIAAALGARHGPAAARRPSDHPRIVIAFAAQAVLIGTLLVSTIGLISSGWGEMIGRTTALDLLTGAFSAAALGLVFLGLPMLVLVAAVAYEWAKLVWRVATMRTTVDPR